MRVLWHSNAPWAPTGYGKQTRLFAPQLRRLGHDVAISAFWGLRGGSLRWDGMSVLPGGLDAHGNDILAFHAGNHFGGDRRGGLVLTLTDIWVLRAERLRELNVAAWVPVDHEPCQPPTVDALRDGRCIPVAMSRFGEEMLADEGLAPVYVPHGVDTTVFRPLDRAESRARLEVPESAFLVGIVAANQSPRKAFPQAVRAFEAFRRRHPEAVLYLHTFLGPELGGVAVDDLLRFEGVPHDAVVACDPYKYALGFPDEWLAGAYSAMDVLLNPAMGEGFGVPIVEAQACGTPVVVTDFSSMPELCGAGFKVGGTPAYTTFKSWQLTPAVDEIVDALERLYALPEAERVALREQARAFAADYDVTVVADRYWVPALEEISRRVQRRPKRARR